jgi:hypothetical protein
MERADTKNSGLSARRRTMHQKTQVVVVGLIMFACMILISCNDKTNGQDYEQQTKNTELAMKEALTSRKLISR